MKKIIMTLLVLVNLVLVGGIVSLDAENYSAKSTEWSPAITESYHDSYYSHNLVHNYNGMVQIDVSSYQEVNTVEVGCYVPSGYRSPWDSDTSNSAGAYASAFSYYAKATPIADPNDTYQLLY